MSTMTYNMGVNLETKHERTNCEEILEAAELFLSWIVRIPQTAKVINNKCLEKCNENKTYTIIRNTMRREKSENIVVTVNISGRRSSGRQSKMMLYGLRWRHILATELIHNTRGQVLWTDMDASASWWSSWWHIPMYKYDNSTYINDVPMHICDNPT